ncbi:MAG: hypothetical protein HUK15_02980 [Bacteroidales bacterium]|nr:hypothetical protein [Bacteroidales bacterium]
MRQILSVLVVLSALLLQSCDKTDKSKPIDLTEYDVDYGELMEKYGYTEFADCDEVLEASNEIVSVFYSTADKAFEENDAKALSDIELFDDLLLIIKDAQSAKYSECPEKFVQWEKDNLEKIAAIRLKISNRAQQQSNDTTIIWTEDVSGEIESVNLQVETLKSEIQRITEEDDSIK